MIDGMPLTVIAARAHGGVIGRGSDLPWRIPTDLARFKAQTLGKPLIVGRRTFEAIGRVLPGRFTIVLSRRRLALEHDGVIDALSPRDALDAAVASARQTGAREIMVGGGCQVFRAFLPVADRLRLTEVDLRVAGDVFFPLFERAAWAEVARVVPQRAEGDEASVAFVDLVRRRRDTPL